MFTYLFKTYEAVEPPEYNHPEKVSLYSPPILDIQTTLNSQWLEEPIDEEPVKEELIKTKKHEEELSPTKLSETPFNYGYDIKSADTKTNRLVSLARQFVGLPYVWGGKSPKEGFDCSGLLSYVYRLNGIDIGYSTYDIFKAGTEVPNLSQARVGDIICTPGTGKTGRHVKMISKIANNEIYVIEAKGKKWGIVEEPLKNKNNITTIRRVIGQQSASTSGKFSNKNDFVSTMVSTYKKSLERNHLDPNYAYVLTAAAALESGWGAKVSGTYNYGGIKSKTGTTLMTTDYIPGVGNVRRPATFKNYKSMQDYCDSVVSLLKKDRYKKAFSLYSSDKPIQFWEYILRAGYGGGSELNIRNYLSFIRKEYNNIKKV